MKIFSLITMMIALLCFSTATMAGECDYCVCTGNTTSNSCTACCSKAEKEGIKPTKLELQISNDNKSIVDQHGNIVAKFSKDIKVNILKKNNKPSSQKLQGCWNCYPECIAWNGNKCVKWIRTCDWDFDCDSKNETKSNSDDFDVNISNGTTHVPIKPSSRTTNNTNRSTSNSNAVHPPQAGGTIDINTKPLTPTTGGCASAEGNGTTVNCD